MDPNGKIRWPGFLKRPSGTPPVLRNSTGENCRFCDISDAIPAKIMNRNLCSFLESKAAFKCFELAVPPLLSYITDRTMITPQMIRFFLNSLFEMKDLRKQALVKEFLDHHLTLHPPCRPGMSAYYFSLLHEPLGSLTFDKGQISDSFLDMFQRLKVAVNEYTSLPSSKNVPVPASSRKAALDFLKQQCKSTAQPTQASLLPQIAELMFVFEYCVDILFHDYEISTRINGIPLLEKIVWGPDAPPGAEKELPPHCHDVIRLLVTVPPRFRRTVGRYLTLLGEIMQQVTHTESDSYVFPLGSNKIVDACVEKFTSSDDDFENAIIIVGTIPSRTFQCQILQGLMYETLLQGADYPTQRKKKYFPLFNDTKKPRRRDAKK